MSLRLPWLTSLFPHVEPGYRRMIGAVLLVTVHAKRVMPVSQMDTTCKMFLV